MPAHDEEAGIESTVTALRSELRPGDRLLVLPSGATPVRSMAVVLDPGSIADGGDGAARPIDLSPLHTSLRDEFPDLNLEGAAVVGDLLRLVQRGNAARRDNAVIDLALGATLARLDSGGPLDDSLLVAVRRVELGELGGVPLGFTDAAPIEPPGAMSASHVAFTAAAERTDNAYDDGPCLGSVLGLLDHEGNVVWTRRLEGLRKFEGLDVDRERGIRLVDDADDRAQRSGLYAIDWPWDDVPGISRPELDRQNGKQLPLTQTKTHDLPQRPQL